MKATLILNIAKMKRQIFGQKKALTANILALQIPKIPFESISRGSFCISIFNRYNINYKFLIV